MKAQIFSITKMAHLISTIYLQTIPTAPLQKLSNQTEEYRGGWSLYDGEIMENFPEVGNGEANQVAYSLLCLRQVVFEDGTVWNNPNYENWFNTYAGKETDIDELKNYYPLEYKIELD